MWELESVSWLSLHELSDLQYFGDEGDTGEVGEYFGEDGDIWAGAVV